MVQILRQSSKDFALEFEKVLNSKRETSKTVDDVVHDIIAEVRENGDAALIDYCAKFDRVTLTVESLAITADEVDAAIKQVPEATFDALKLAHQRIKFYHEKQLPQDCFFQDSIGVELGWRWNSVESVGLYVPGGTASYPSSVLMNAIPAKVAGVERIVIVVPTPDGVLNPLVLAAAKLVGVDEIYRIGGAQAVAALAYGTKTIAPVVKIVGPGNAYVAAAKRQVFGKVGIDMIAGPSEVLLIADKNNNPHFVAADLLAQAEHDEAAQSIFMTDDAEFADAVIKALEQQLQTLSRKAIAAKSWHDFGAVIIVDDLLQAHPLINQIAAEHLQLMVENEEQLLAGIKNAGAIFVGAYTPVVIGDYIGGSNHVLPTARSARFSSSLTVLDYMKRSSIMKLGQKQMHAIGKQAALLAKSEGLEAHALSAKLRFDE